MPRAIADREFTVNFQPIVDLASGRMVAAEALARWRHPARGDLDPRRFLAAVERSGLLPAFDEAVLDQALAALTRWRAAGVMAQVAVNSGPRSILDPDYPDLVDRQLARYGLTGEDLVVELTEKASVATAKAITLADLKPGAYVGVTTRKGADGALVALEVHTLPPTVKPGFRPWDLAPDTMMTNANIASVKQGAGGHELVMKLPDGEQKIIVPSGTPVVTQVKAGRSDLKPGEYVFFNANVGADGKLTVPGRIQVSKAGVKPPQ